MQPSRYRIHAAALRYFDAVRRAGSIREAARRLNVASSAVNRQILALEAEVKTPLFERLSGGLRLTAAGEILARHVIMVLHDAERFESELDALHGLQAGHVDLVTLEGLCHRIVPAAIAQMARQYPRITIAVSIMATESIPRAIINGEAHLGLAFEVRPHPELRRLASARFRLGAVVAPGSPFAKASQLSIGALRDTPVILPRSNFANREQLHAALFRAGMRDRGRYEAGSVELMKQLVLRGHGVAFLTRVGLETELESGRLVHVALRQGSEAIDSELGLYTNAGGQPPVAAEMFAHQLAEAMADAAAEEGMP